MSNQFVTPALMERRFVPGPEVMKLLGYSNPAAFYQFVRAEGVQFIKLNQRRIVFDEAVLSAWLEKRTVGGAS